MDINEQIKKETDKIIDEKLPLMIREYAEKMINNVIKGVFESYGDTAKAVKEKIEKSLDINLQRYDTVDYNALVSKVINDNIVSQVNLQPILDLTKDAIGFIEKKTINLSEIIDMVIVAAKEDSYEDDGEISLYVNENSENKWIEVYFDIEKDKNENDCGVRFIYSSDSGRIFSLHSQSWGDKLGSVTPAKLASMSHLEHKIFRLYSAQVKIETDTMDFETEWYKYEY